MSGKELPPLRIKPEEKRDGLDLSPNALHLRVSFFGRTLDIPLAEDGYQKINAVLEKHGRELVAGGTIVAGAAIGVTIAYCHIRSKQNHRDEAIETKKTDPIQPVSEKVKAEFEATYKRLHSQILSYALYRLRNQQDAEDLTHRVFTNALVAWPKFNPQIAQERGAQDPHKTWLLHIANNLAINWHRERQRRPKNVPLENLYFLGTSDEYKIPDTDPVFEKLSKKIQQFPPDWQLLLFLKYHEELPDKDIALVLGRTDGAAKAFLHRTLAGLRNKATPLASRRSGPADRS